MTRTLPLALVVAALTAACTQATPEQQIVNDAAEALGGRDRIVAAKSITIEGGGTNGNLGQDLTPERREQTFTVSNFTRVIDLAAGRSRTEQTRTPTFAYFQGPQAQTQVMGIDGDVGYNVGANGTATRVPNATAADRRMEVYHHPLTIVRAALEPTATLANPRTSGTERVVDVTTAGGLKFTLTIDGTSHRPTRVTSMTDNTNLGDVAVETAFADYQDVNGLQLPARLTTTIDGVMMADIRATKQTLDGTIGDLAAPAAAASAAPITGPAPANVVATEVSKGIWLLGGQSHHSVLVEFADHLTLIEAPQNDVRTLAVIAKARELVPGKPLTTMISSHHHFDHSGGIRAAVAEGLTLIAQQGAVAYYQNAAQRAHTLVPDALAKSPKDAKVQGVDDELILNDAAMTVNLYRVKNTGHADTMLMAYFPKERILVEADVYTPGAAIHMYAKSLLDNIAERKLRVDRIVPLHGAIGSYADLVKTQTPAAAN